MYEDAHRWGYLFQSYVLLTMMELHHKEVVRIMITDESTRLQFGGVSGWLGEGTVSRIGGNFQGVANNFLWISIITQDIQPPPVSSSVACAGLSAQECRMSPFRRVVPSVMGSSTTTKEHFVAFPSFIVCTPPQHFPEAYI